MCVCVCVWHRPLKLGGLLGVGLGMEIGISSRPVASQSRSWGSGRAANESVPLEISGESELGRGCGRYEVGWRREIRGGRVREAGREERGRQKCVGWEGKTESDDNYPLDFFSTTSCQSDCPSVKRNNVSLATSTLIPPLRACSPVHNWPQRPIRPKKCGNTRALACNGLKWSWYCVYICVV